MLTKCQKLFSPVIFEKITVTQVLDKRVNCISYVVEFKTKNYIIFPVRKSHLFGISILAKYLCGCATVLKKIY